MGGGDDWVLGGGQLRIPESFIKRPLLTVFSRQSPLQRHLRFLTILSTNYLQYHILLSRIKCREKIVDSNSPI